MPYFAPVDKKPSTACYTKVACAVTFCVFSLVYLLFYQCDVLTAGQHVLSGGQTHYNRFVGAFLITLVLYLLQMAVANYAKLTKRAYALTYFPSLLVLTIITDVSSTIDQGFSFGGWLVAVPLLLIAFCALVWALRQMESFEPEPASQGLFSRTVWINLLTMAVMFILVGLFSNGDEVFHYRMRMERLLMNGRTEDALKVGKKDLATDSSLLMLRAYALARNNALGDHLFDYPVGEGNVGLLPDGHHRKTIVMPDSAITIFAKSGKARADYHLMELLIQRRLDAFANVVYDIYPDSVMPKHFEEALILYHYYSGKPLPQDQNKVIEADFYDFLNMERTFKDDHVANRLRKVYQNTYWYYYKYGGNKTPRQ